MAKVIFIFEDSNDDGQVSFKAEFDPTLDMVDEENPTDAQALAGVAFSAVTDFINGTGCKGNCACK